MPPRYARIIGWGRYVPERILTNAYFAAYLDTSDEWITQRTGIKERRVRTEKDTNTSMAVAAGQEALAVAGITPQELDCIIVCTSSEDYPLPPAGGMVQAALGATCTAFQLSAGCSGWVYGSVVADSLIKTGQYHTVLVIGVELPSYALDYQDRNTCILFGDAAAATVMQASDTPCGILSSELGTDGKGAKAIWIEGGGSAMPVSQEVLDKRLQYGKMNGPEVFKFATRVIGSSLNNVIEKAGLTPDDIDLFIPHQSNLRIIETAARLMNQPMDKFYVNLERYGNTSSASVPLAMVEAIQEGRIQPGDTVAMVAFGVGLSWGAMVVKMGEDGRW
jgi:3-oxoacyl-[acyl-carrier-protein] synthase-3